MMLQLIFKIVKMFQGIRDLFTYISATREVKSDYRNSSSMKLHVVSKVQPFYMIANWAERLGHYQCGDIQTKLANKPFFKTYWSNHQRIITLRKVNFYDLLFLFIMSIELCTMDGRLPIEGLIIFFHS